MTFNCYTAIIRTNQITIKAWPNLGAGPKKAPMSTKILTVEYIAGPDNCQVGIV